MSIESEHRKNPKSYNITYFDKGTFGLFIKGLEKYLAELQKGRKIETEFGIEKSELVTEIYHLEGTLTWLKEKLERNKDRWHVDFLGEGSVSEVTLRLLKSALVIERDDVLRRRAELIRKNKNIPKVILDGIDEEVARLGNNLQIGIFATLEPYSLMVPVVNPEDLVTKQVAIENKPDTKELIIKEEKKDFDTDSKTTILEYTKERITIYDDELRSRMENLLAEKQEGRYDTALREVGAVMEDRIRRKATLPKSLFGDELIQSALNPGNGKLIVSGDEKNRQGFFRLITGFMEYIRNPNSHNLSGDVARERAIQIASFADYLLFTLEDSKPRTNK